MYSCHVVSISNYTYHVACVSMYSCHVVCISNYTCHVVCVSMYSCHVVCVSMYSCHVICIGNYTCDVVYVSMYSYHVVCISSCTCHVVCISNCTCHVVCVSNYTDVCAMLRGDKTTTAATNNPISLTDQAVSGVTDGDACPDLLAKNNLPCRCPFNAGLYKLPPTTFVLPDLGTLSALAKVKSSRVLGRYHVCSLACVQFLYPSFACNYVAFAGWLTGCLLADQLTVYCILGIPALHVIMWHSLVG